MNWGGGVSGGGRVNAVDGLLRSVNLRLSGKVDGVEEE